MALLGRVAVQRLGVDALGAEILGQLLGLLALVDEHHDAADVDFLLDGPFVLGRFASDGEDGFGTGEVLVISVGVAGDVNDTELHATGDGVEVRRDDAPHLGVVDGEVVIELFGDGGGAADELLQGRRGSLDDAHGHRRKAAVEKRVSLVDDEVGDAGQDVGVGIGHGGEQMRCGDDDIEALGRIYVALNLLGLEVGGEHLCLELGDVGDGLGDTHDLLAELGRGHQDDNLGPRHSRMWLVKRPPPSVALFLSLLFRGEAFVIGGNVRIVRFGLLDGVDGG